MIAILLVLLTAAQKPATAPNTYALNVVTKDGFTEVSLTAEGARLTTIAEDLAKRLKARVIVGPSMQPEVVWAKFSDSALEPALISIAPRVYVDYEIRQGAPPLPVGIYLLGAADPEPLNDAVVRGPAMGLMITGNTEDPADGAKEDPLRVVGDRHRLSIMSRQQPLGIVLVAIGEVLGAPVELKYDATDVVDANIAEMRAEDAIARLSPNVRLYVRADLGRVDRSVLRIVAARPDPK